jgi:hypothetical protein
MGNGFVVGRTFYRLPAGELVIFYSFAVVATEEVVVRELGGDVASSLSISGLFVFSDTPMYLSAVARRGVEVRLIVGDHYRSAPVVDLSLVKAVARAHRWFDELSTGKASSLAEIVVREGLAVRYVGRLIRLAFLAPEIVESIIEGRQPAALTAEAPIRRIELTLAWR